jgi:hypothetical protein
LASRNTFNFNPIDYGRASATQIGVRLDNGQWFEFVRVSGGLVQMAMTFMAVVAGMIFSLAVALLAEELIFGQVFRLFFAQAKLAPQAVTVKEAVKR